MAVAGAQLSSVQFLQSYNMTVICACRSAFPNKQTPESYSSGLKFRLCCLETSGMNATKASMHYPNEMTYAYKDVYCRQVS